MTWIEHTYAPQPPPLDAPRAVQTHGNRDFISASFEHGQKLGKPSGACTRCKKLKMKCELRSGEHKCQRCKGGDYDCVPARRRPRRPRALGGAPSPGQLRRIQGVKREAPAEEDDVSEAEDDSDEPRLPAKTSPMGMIARMAAGGGEHVKGEDTASEITTVGDDAQPPAAVGIGHPGYFQSESASCVSLSSWIPLPRGPFGSRQHAVAHPLAVLAFHSSTSTGARAHVPTPLRPRVYLSIQSASSERSLRTRRRMTVGCPRPPSVAACWTTGG